MEPAEYQQMAVAEELHWWYAGLHDLILRIVRAETATLKRPMDILDAGCGTGRLGQLLQSFGNVTGCDIHPLALEAAASRGIRTLRRDLAADGLGDRQYDLITCVDVLYHRAVADEQAALRNLHRALRPGGLLILHLPAFEMLRGAHDLAVHTRRRYRRGEMVRLLETSGFTVKFASYRLCLFFLPALLWRSWTRLFAPRSDLASSPLPRANRLLLCGLRAENRLLATSIPLPFGVSVFALARKNGQKELPPQYNPQPPEMPMLDLKF